MRTDDTATPTRRPEKTSPFTVDRWAFAYYVSTRPPAEQAIWWSRERERNVIAAMQRRINRNPIRGFLWRRPWRSSARPNLRSLRDVAEWVRAAHNCADPSIGCSCTGGYRFPRNHA
ncbi:hypothetical protein [Micromonospora wenchangensis]|uniref:hypothetical protein n=1 Tax=Micromonospora wenchangensis TaxID=1185415 RepID=UPI00382DC714